MSEAAFAVDDDWGTGLTEIEYPTLHSKQQVSKSVLRKRRKAAQRLQELSKNAVLPGWALQLHLLLATPNQLPAGLVRRGNGVDCDIF